MGGRLQSEFSPFLLFPIYIKLVFFQTVNRRLHGSAVVLIFIAAFPAGVEVNEQATDITSFSQVAFGEVFISSGAGIGDAAKADLLLNIGEVRAQVDFGRQRFTRRDSSGTKVLTRHCSESASPPTEFIR